MQKTDDALHEQLHLMTVVDRGAGAELIQSSTAGFLEAAGRPKKDACDEHYSNLDELLRGPETWVVE